MKPSLFKNEFLATSDPINTVIFEGLWCMADREGRLEDRPRRIHLEINAGRAYETTEAALAWLAEHGFILRYVHGSNRFIQIVNFAKHQSPHFKEPDSVIPEPGISTEPEASLGQASVEPQSSRADSGFLIPDSPSLNPEEEAPRAKRAQPATHLPDDFELTDERRKVATTEGLDADRTFAKFCNYWRSAAGQRARKRDWNAAWRFWCQNDRAPNAAGRGAYQEPKTTWRPPPDDEENPRVQ